MAVDTFIAYVGVYDTAGDADADYELVKDLHTKAGLIDSYDAAVIERRADGKVKITRKHETPTRVGGVLGAGVGLATGLVVALFPFAAIGGGLLAATTGGGAVLGAVAQVHPQSSRVSVMARSTSTCGVHLATASVISI